MREKYKNKYFNIKPRWIGFDLSLFFLFKWNKLEKKVWYVVKNKNDWYSLIKWFSTTRFNTKKSLFDFIIWQK